MDDGAAAQVISFLVAGTVLITAIGAMLLSTQELAPEAEGQEGADALADIIAGSAGIGWGGGPDSLARLGLLNANGSGLDSVALEALRGAQFDSTNNGKVDYEDAKSGLGVDGDFHIRMYPVGLRQAYGSADLSGLQTAYVGDWANLPSATLLLGSDEAMIAAAQTEVNSTMEFITGLERQILVDIGLGFDDLVNLESIDLEVDLPIIDLPLADVLADPLLLQGDVYPDNKAYLDTVFSTQVASYDVLVVGSNVAHNSLTSNVVKSAIETFVLNGGTLIVFGSSGQNFQWLQPLFDVGESTVNGAAYAPDINHPALLYPHALSWDQYDTQGLAWDIKSQGAGAHFDDFDHVIMADDETILGISNSGTFGDGRIFLTSFQPAHIANTFAYIEAHNFVDNVVLYLDQEHLYLDYGPTVPSGAEVDVAIRQSWIWDERLGQVPVRIEVLSW